MLQLLCPETVIMYKIWPVYCYSIKSFFPYIATNSEQGSIKEVTTTTDQQDTGKEKYNNNELCVIENNATKLIAGPHEKNIRYFFMSF